jgi:gas vesicle protein
MSTNNGSGSTLTAFLVGAAAGGTAALLFAPMKGEKLRERIAERGEDLKERTTASARGAADKSRELVDGARDTARHQAAALNQAIEEGKAAYWRELDKAATA